MKAQTPCSSFGGLGLHGNAQPNQGIIISTLTLVSLDPMARAVAMTTWISGQSIVRALPHCEGPRYKTEILELKAYGSCETW